jgi:hypothetical protein
MSKDSHTARMRRRIWWSIYVRFSVLEFRKHVLTHSFIKVRERQAAASLGLPSRIRDEDCDIEPLSPSDLESEISSVDSPFGSCQPEHVTYAIKMVEIAKLREYYTEVHFFLTSLIISFL